MIRKNDNVIVISGKEKGKKGKVLSVLFEKDRAIVEKINMVKRHQRPTQKLPRGGVIEKEASIHVSNLMLFCPKCNKGVRSGVKMEQDGKKTRTCKKCGETLGQ